MRRLSPSLTVIILGVLGAALLAAAGVLRFSVRPAMDQLPADFDRTARYTGTGTFLNPAALQNPAVPPLIQGGVQVARRVRVVSASGGGAVVQEAVGIVLSQTGTPVDSATHTWSLNRETLGGAPAAADATGVLVPEGLTVAFPPDVTPRDYTSWDTATQSTAPATYQGSRTMRGRKAYDFHVDADGPVQDAETLASLPQTVPKQFLPTAWRLARLTPAQQAQLTKMLPALPSDVPLAYTAHDVVDTWVDAATGVPLQQQETRRITPALMLGTTVMPLRIPAFTLSIASTAASIRDAAAYAAGVAGDRLWAGTIAPSALLVAGALALGAAPVLMLRRRRLAAAAHPPTAAGRTPRRTPRFAGVSRLSVRRASGARHSGARHAAARHSGGGLRRWQGEEADAADAAARHRAAAPAGRAEAGQPVGAQAPGGWSPGTEEPPGEAQPWSAAWSNPLGHPPYEP